MRTLVVSNSAAGSAAPEVLQKSLLEPLGAEGDLLECRDDEDLQSAVVRRIETFRPQRIVACGGDGTVAAVAAAIVQADARIELAVVPMGTANVFALELGVGTDLEEACRLAREGTARPHDFLRTRDGLALCRFLIGNLSEPGRCSTPDSKRRWKLFAYLLRGLPHLFRPQGSKFRLEIDGRKIVTRASSVIVCNAGRTGLAEASWAASVQADDGVADVLVVHSTRFRDHLRLIWSWWWGRHESSPWVTHWTARRHIRIRIPEAVACSRDGEQLEGRVLDIEVVPRALLVVAAAPAKERGVALDLALQHAAP